MLFKNKKCYRTATYTIKYALPTIKIKIKITILVSSNIFVIKVRVCFLCRDLLLSVLAAHRLDASEESIEKKQPRAWSVA